MGFNVGASPDPEIARGATRYQQQNGLHVPARHPGFGGVVMAGAATQRISAAYERLPSFDHAAVPAYRAMREQVGRQFDFMTKSQSKGGLGIDVNPTAHDPYGKHTPDTVVHELRDDIHSNGRISVLSTKATGGHPYFSNDENDMFRGVHDVFGHLGAGRGVDRHGEEAAYQKHSTMFTPLAQQALATETRGQNSYLHRNGGFPEQKVAILPGAMRRANFMAAHTSAADRQQAVDDNRKQGL